MMTYEYTNLASAGLDWGGVSVSEDVDIGHEFDAMARLVIAIGLSTPYLDLGHIKFVQPPPAAPRPDPVVYSHEDFYT